jgi:hypothetical protein
MFNEVQFEHNRGFLLLGDLKSPYQPVQKLGVDTQLLQFLQQLPSLFPLEFPIQQNVFKTVDSVLKYRLCGGSMQHFELLFGAHPTIIQPGEGGGSTCGYVFKQGDTIYRCHDCGFDGTCVLCTKCFRSGDHQGHSISMHISQGSGGCCDCGDAEAWKLPMTCKIHGMVQHKTDHQPFPDVNEDNLGIDSID